MAEIVSPLSCEFFARWAVHVAGFKALRDQALLECDAVPATPALRR